MSRRATPGTRSIPSDRRDRGDRGVSLIEVTIAMTLAVVVMGTVMGSFITFSRAEQRQSSAIDERQDMRRALDEISRTLRSAWPLRPAADPSSARTELTFEVPDDGSGRTTRRLRLDADQGEVILETLDDADARNVVDRRLVLTAATAPATPFLRYFAVGDRELIPGEQTPKMVSACAVRLRITLGRTSASGDGSVDMTTDVTLRNVAPEEVSC